MSDERFTQSSAELSTALHEFAEERETPPALSGAEVRGRAVRRVRRRRAGTLAAGTAALALVAFALTLDRAGEENHRQVPAATPAVPSPPPATSREATSVMPTVGKVDLDRSTLAVGDRVMTITSSVAGSPKPVGPLTVYRKLDNTVLPVTNPTDGTRYNTDVSLAVELRDADDQPFYVGAILAYETKGIGKYDTTSGWISLDAADAKWFFTSVKTGSSFSVTGSASAGRPAATPKLPRTVPARPNRAEQEGS
ncbi:L,D-transpeptidase [Streptomyces sp. GESEQ-4]|uniref:L,D-transpeptidase n=1 Tax=Streptomyces sp. GESEQ-4 TaxID=2812655 RepID=UPI001B3301B9|nr:L,D-transpeptidase [Streptomyces sp. GESEQ-4]